MLYSGLLTFFSSYPRTRRQKDCRSLSSSTLSWFTWVCAGYFLFSLWVRISLPTGAASPPETVRCSLLFSVLAHLAIKRFKSICPLHLCPLFSVRRHRICWPQLWTQQRRMRCAEPWCNKAFFWVVIRRRLRLPAAFIPRSRSSSTSWLSGLIGCTPALLWQPLLPTRMGRVTVMRNHGSIRQPLTQVAQHLPLFLIAMLSNLLAAAVLFSHGALLGGFHHHAPGGASERVGDGHVGQRTRLLFLLWQLLGGDRSAQGTEAARALELLRQRESSVSSYSIVFRTLAASCGWNDKALWDHFLHGLAEHIKDEIYSLEIPSSLDGLIDLAIRVDNRISLRSRHLRSGFPPEPRQERRATCPPNISGFPRRSRCKSGEHGWRSRSSAIAWITNCASTVGRQVTWQRRARQWGGIHRSRENALWVWLALNCPLVVVVSSRPLY